MYHEVGEAGTSPEGPVASWTVSPERFREQLEALAQAGYTGVSVAKWLDLRDKPSAGLKPVVITFDDGYRGNVENAIPALTERGWTATFFVVSGRMGWEDYAPPEAWRDVAAAGMDVASHTATHPFLGALTTGAVRAELLDSRIALEQATGAPVHGISWPNGDPPSGGTALALECGYRWTATSRAGFAGPRTSPLALPRLPVRAWCDTAGILALIDARLAHRSRLAAAYWAKRLARAALGRRRYAQLQTKVMEH
jgi:peptidoglycan/xylan/chitin deacetylase (PgdA/CDA1 family)